jgi:hypothetical protein
MSRSSSFSDEKKYSRQCSGYSRVFVSSQKSNIDAASTFVRLVGFALLPEGLSTISQKALEMW